ETHKSVANCLLRQCDQVQRGVWQPKNTIYENAFSPGNLVVMELRGRVQAFFSVEAFKITTDKLGIYYSDCMRSSKFHGKSLFKTVTFLLDCFLRQKYSAETIYHVVLTGNLYLFKHFVQSPFMTPLPIWDQSEDAAAIRKKISELFNGHPIENSGI